jgi:hypothetical protein
MKKKYYFIWGLGLLTFSFSFISWENAVWVSNNTKNIIQLMAVDSVTYYLNPNEPVYYEYDQRGNLI